MITVFAHERVNTDRVVELTGATPRQLGYWVNSGYLHPHNAGEGTGYALLWPPEEIEAAKRITQLLGLGFHLQAAASLARQASGRAEVAAALRGMGETP